jgi:TPR repeat protein/AcrR family transcriptional regulator
MADEKMNTAEKQDVVRRRRPARRAILEVARRILLRDGSDALTPEAVVKETGLSAEIVYAYFCNKDELLLSIASDELSMLARDGKDGGDAEMEGSEGSKIRELPRMVEGLIAARAAEIEAASGAKTDNDMFDHLDTAPETDDVGEDENDDTENDNTYETSDDEGRRDENGAGFSLETLRRDVPRTRRRPNQGREIDGIVKELTGGEQQGEGAVSATLARLERRLYLIERNMAEAAERAEAEARRASEAPTFSNDDVAALVGRVANLERRLAEVSEDLHAGQKSTLERLRILEATPPAGPSVAEKVPATEEVAVETVETKMDPDATVILKDESLGAFLAAARQAAKSAVEETRNSDEDSTESFLGRWKQKANDLLGRTSHMDRKTLLTRVVPIPLVVVGLAVTVWAAMNAGEVAATTGQPANPPGTVVAMSMGSEPQITVSPFDQMTAGAESGNVTAQAALGLAYLDGNGVQANEEFAISWLQLAAENSQPVAQYSLASLYAREDSAIYDPDTAKYWFQSAAENGNRMAMNNLAMFYAQGLGTEANIGEAAHWFSMAAALGYRIAQYNLAVLYERGDGVPRDLVQSYKWYALAAAQGDADARERLGILSERMDPETLQEAQAAFEAFEPAPLDPAANERPVFPRQRG